MHLRMFAVLAAFVACVPFALSAQTLNQGCRYATEADKKAMADRGIPQKFEVCPADEKILGIGRDFDQWYAQLKTESQCSKNTCTLSCRTRNTGAQRCGPTASRWNSIGCHQHNSTAIFPTVSHGFAAHIELLRRYCGERGRCTINSAIMQWAPPTVHNNSTGSYIAFVSRVAGMPANQVYNPNDIDLMARLAMAMSCYEAGSLPYSLQDLKQGLVMASGGARVPVPSNVGQLLEESMKGSFAPYPSGTPGSYPGSWGYPPMSTGGQLYMPPKPPAQPLPIIDTYSNPTNNVSASVGTPQNIGGTASGSGSSNSAGVVFPSTSIIIAQPSRVKYGESTMVSWTSVGMSTNGCRVYSGSTLLGQNMQGTVSIPVDAAATSMTFTLKCETVSGETEESSASVTLVQ